MNAQKVPFQTGQLISLLMDIAVGMNFLHSLNIVHRDMHLDNFLLSHDFYVKICDFGMGKIIDEHETNTADVGAMIIRAPESYTTQHGTQCDVWSFGVVLSMLYKTGRDLPFPHGNGEDRSDWLAEKPDDPEKLKYYENLRCMLGAVVEARLASYRSTALEHVKEPFLNLAQKCLCFLHFNRPTFSGVVELILALEKTTGIRRQREYPLV